MEPDSLGKPEDDQGDVRLAAGLPLSVHVRQRRVGRDSLKRALLFALAVVLAVASAATAARIKGTRHADRLQTVNRVRDVVSCGAGHDLATVDLLDRVARDCETVTREISRDPYRNPGSSHETQVEPDTFAAGRAVVAVFQSGRFFDGGATNIGFAVSRNRGVTWRHGFLPGLTQGGGRRASDPAVTYDAAHRIWLAVSLVFGTDSYALAISRSPDGLHWAAPVTARLVASTGPEALDKEWIGCDNWASSPFRGRCYLTYSDLGTTQIATQVSSDGGLTWGPPVSGPGFPGRQAILGAYAPAPQVAVLRDGTALLLYFDETQISVLRSSDGGASWSGALPVTPARYSPHPGFRAGPISSAEVGADGNAYVAWADCSRRAGCAANDIVLIRSADGIGWSAPTRIPTGTADAELPGLAADPSRPGRLALAYYTLRGSTLDVGFVSSRNGGARWTKPTRLNSRSFPMAWIARTSLGSMVGDYISTSFAGGRAVPVFALATAPRGATLHEAMFSASLPVG